MRRGCERTGVLRAPVDVCSGARSADAGSAAEAATTDEDGATRLAFDGRRTQGNGAGGVHDDHAAGLRRSAVASPGRGGDAVERDVGELRDAHDLVSPLAGARGGVGVGVGIAQRGRERDVPTRHRVGPDEFVATGVGDAGGARATARSPAIQAAVAAVDRPVLHLDEHQHVADGHRRAGTAGVAVAQREAGGASGQRACRAGVVGVDDSRGGARRVAARVAADQRLRTSHGRQREEGNQQEPGWRCHSERKRRHGGSSHQ